MNTPIGAGRGNHDEFNIPSKADENSDEVLRGFREFDVIIDVTLKEPRIMLKGRFSQPWEGPYMKALCGGVNGEDVVGQHIADRGCNCGIYSYKQLDRFFKANESHWGCTTTDFSISGGRIHTNNIQQIKAVTEVVSWGNLIEGSMGWRAEFVRIEHILLNMPANICSECNKPLIPTTRNNQDGTLYWLCDYTNGELIEQLRNRLVAQLTAYYQCPVTLLDNGDYNGKPWQNG